MGGQKSSLAHKLAINCNRLDFMYLTALKVRSPEAVVTEKRQKCAAE